MVPASIFWVADYTEQIRAEETNYLENVSGVS